MDAEGFRVRSGVSRETVTRLQDLEAVLNRWNPRINLVARSTLGQFWSRHVLDSWQLVPLVPDTARSWIDLGSGGGFPGLVVAILSAEQKTAGQIKLIESDQRKCAFLRTVLRETGVTGQVIANRIEDIPPQNASVLSARALVINLEPLFEQPKWSYQMDFHRGKNHTFLVI